MRQTVQTILALALIVVGVGGVVAQDDACTREAVIASFAEAVQAGDVDAWAQWYAASACPPAIKAGARALAAVYEMMGAEADAGPEAPPASPTSAPTDTPEPSPTPDEEALATQPAEPSTDPALPTSYPLLIDRSGGNGLHLLNLAPAPFPLAALSLGTGADAIAGAAWGLDALQLRECVVAWSGEGDLQRPDESCREVGERVTRADSPLWEGALDVSYEGVAVGRCEAGQPACFIIVTLPVATPAPTPETPVIDCPGAPLSRLAVGEGARVIGGNRELFDSPAGAPVMTLLETAPFIVEDGPQCANRQVWWQVRTMNGVTGWISEGARDGYRTEMCPLVGVPDHNLQCPGAQPSRVRVGQNRLRVITQGLRLRSQPSLSGATVHNLDFYELLVITGAPVCADGAIWWPVQATGARREGWVAEATNQEWHTVPDPWLGCEAE
ncbi:MAG: hypothetical protein Kow00120_20470 [Anaerolineae bacterium]